jgi:hypothetical protein
MFGHAILEAKRLAKNASLANVFFGLKIWREECDE